MRTIDRERSHVWWEKVRPICRHGPAAEEFEINTTRGRLRPYADGMPL